MQIIYGKTPKLINNKSKYSDLWEALRNTNPAGNEWLAISTNDINGSTRTAKKNLICGAAKTAKLSVQVVVEDELIFVRLRPASAKTTETPAVKPAAPQPKPEQAGQQPSPSPEAKRSLSEAPKTIPAPVAPAPKQAAPIILLSSDLSAFLSDTVTCAGKWNELDLGDNVDTYRPALREFRKLAAIRCVDVESRISDGYLHARIKK